MLIGEKAIRRIIREEFERLMELPSEPEEVRSIKSGTGGEIIIPNPAKEAFERGEVKSFGDI